LEETMVPLHRAQILLEPEQHRILTEIARSEGRSISDLVREIVRQYLVEQKREVQAQIQALEELAQMRRQLHAQHGVYEGDLLTEVRAEREQDVERVWQDQP
jgi:DNA-binding MarR family transcriptional regulator